MTINFATPFPNPAFLRDFWGPAELQIPGKSARCRYLQSNFQRRMCRSDVLCYLYYGLF